MEIGEDKRTIDKVDFIEMKNFNNYLLDSELYKVFDFGFNYGNKNIKIFRIVERHTRYTVGAVEFLLTPMGLDIKIGLNSAYRYNGNGTKLLKMIIKSFGESLNNTEYFVAHIAPDNLASQKLFSKCGFASDFDEIETELAEGYLTYKKRNPNYGKKNYQKDEVIFCQSDDANAYYKLEIFKNYDVGNIKSTTARVAFIRIYDGMEILTDYQDNIEELVKTIWYIESRFEVVFSDSMYFTYVLRISKNTNKRNYIELFKKYNFTLDEYSSTDDCLVFKRLNKHYVEDLNQILKRTRTKGEEKI